MSSDTPQNFVRRMRPLFGTYVEVGGDNSKSRAAAGIERAFDVLQQVQASLSFQDAGSELSRVNCSAGGTVPISPLLARVLGLARRMHLASRGLFNHAVGGALIEQGRLPNHDGRDVVPVGRLEDFALAPDSIRLRRPVRITLDGIAKGYGVDLAIRELRRQGISAGWVNAGGDIRVFGALALPVSRRNADGSMQFLGYLRDAAVATSQVAPGQAEHFPALIVSGSGKTVAPGLWSVVAQRAWRADALTKIAANSPASLQQEMLARLGGRLVPAALPS